MTQLANCAMSVQAPKARSLKPRERTITQQMERTSSVPTMILLTILKA